MQLPGSPLLAGFIVLGALTLGGCASSSINPADNAIASSGMDLTLFAEGAFTQEPEIVDCETAEDTVTTCYKLVTSGAPAGREPGPFCPRTITDGADVSGAWFSKDGTELSGPAPVDAILGAYTIAAFDDCGGHINVHQGYHYHSTTGCTDTTDSDSEEGHAPLIGYHYHAASPSENLFI